MGIVDQNDGRIKIKKHSDISEMTLEKAREIMDKDKILSKKEMQITINIIKTVFASSVYLVKIKDDLCEIIEIGINIKDIPIAIDIIIDTKKIIFSLLSEDIYVSHKMMKYVIFSILYYNIIEDGIITNLEENVLEIFEKSWKLISYNPFYLMKPITNIEASCCYIF